MTDEELDEIARIADKISSTITHKDRDFYTGMGFWTFVGAVGLTLLGTFVFGYDVWTSIILAVGAALIFGIGLHLGYVEGSRTVRIRG